MRRLVQVALVGGVIAIAVAAAIDALRPTDRPGATLTARQPLSSPASALGERGSTAFYT